MLIVFLVFCLAVIITYLGNRSASKKGLEYAFILLAVFFSIRYGYGNDYYGYLGRFEEYSRCSSISNLFSYFYSDDTLFLSEIGWGLINYMFKPLGFPLLVAFLTFFDFFIFYKIIKIYVPQKYQWLAVFVFVFTPQLLLIQLSMMRQTLAMVLVLYAIHLFFSRRKLPATICVLSAIIFHKSSLYVLPFFSLVFFFKYNKIWKYSSIILVFLFIVLYLTHNQLSNLYALTLDNELVAEYSHYGARDESQEMKLGLGFLISYIPFILMIRYLWVEDTYKYIKIFIFFSALGFSLTPITYVESLLGRFIFYFLIFKIIGIPYSYYSVKKTIYRISLLIIFILLSVYSCYSFMTSPTWIKGYSTYHTIFEIL